MKNLADHLLRYEVEEGCVTHLTYLPQQLVITNDQIARLGHFARLSDEDETILVISDCAGQVAHYRINEILGDIQKCELVGREDRSYAPKAEPQSDYAEGYAEDGDMPCCSDEADDFAGLELDLPCSVEVLFESGARVEYTDVTLIDDSNEDGALVLGTVTGHLTVVSAPRLSYTVLGALYV